MSPRLSLGSSEFSLRWKAFLVLLTVLACVHSGLAYNGYLNLRNQYDQQVADDFAKYRTTLAALFEQAGHDADEQGRALAAVASIEDLPWVGELFFKFTAVRYYDAVGLQLAEWTLAGTTRDDEELQRERRAAQVAARAAAAQIYVECPDACLLRALLPVFERGGRNIIVAVTYPLDDTLRRFRLLSGADVALTVRAGPDAAQLWNRRVAAITDGPRLMPLLAAITEPEPPAAQILPIAADERTVLVAVEPLPIKTQAAVQALLMVDQTDRLALIALNLRNYVTLALFGLVLATAAIFILLTPSLRRLAQITDGLPLLAAQRFDEARRLFKRAARRSGMPDEIDRLNHSAVALANRLEKLMGAEAASEAKSQFLAAMSHEIRTPINGVLGLLELHESTDLSDAQRESVRIMRDSALTLLAVVDDILDFSKIEAGQLNVHPVPMSLREAVEGALETMAATAGSKGLRLACYVQPEIPAQVRSDPVRLRQVLLNLCSNAIKFTAQGQVAVSLETDDPAADPLRIRCTVRDTGIGIPKEAHSRLFKPFSQAEASTSRSYGGTGLGLSISRGLIERMGGRMGFASAVGQGSEFWFELECPVVTAAPPALPSLDGVAVHVAATDGNERSNLGRYLASAGAQLVDGTGEWQLRLEELGHTGFRLTTAAGTSQVVGRPVRYALLLRESAQLCGRASPPSPETAPRAPAPVAAMSGRVLVAEDHPTNRRVIRQQLERLGFEADIVDDGHQALERIAHGRYAFLITDLHMPGLDGLALTQEIRRREAADGRPPLPIVGLTADVLPAAVDRCREAGMSDVLRKPIAIAELGRTLARWAKSAGGTPALDRAALSRLLGTDDAAMLRETLDDFLRISAENMAELFATLQAGDVAGVQRIAHRMSGAARTVAAADLAQAAAELERAAQQGRSEEFAPLHCALCMDFERVRRELAPAGPAPA